MWVNKRDYDRLVKQADDTARHIENGRKLTEEHEKYRADVRAFFGVEAMTRFADHLTERSGCGLFGTIPGRPLGFQFLTAPRILAQDVPKAPTPATMDDIDKTRKSFASAHESLEKRMTAQAETIIAQGNLIVGMRVAIGRLEKMVSSDLVEGTPHSAELTQRIHALEAKTDGHGDALENIALDHEVLVKLVDHMGIEVTHKNPDEALDVVFPKKAGAK